MEGNDKLSCIYIYYRHVNSESQLNKSRPEWFTYERAFLSLINSIRSSATQVKVDITIFFDGDEKSFESDFISKYLTMESDIGREFSLKCEIVKGGSATGAWREALPYIKSRKKYQNNELIYFLENDYIHAPNWITEIDNLFNSGIRFDYASLYDHSDKYPLHAHFNNAYKKLRSQIFVTSSCHWRTTHSTCGTFLVRPNIFFDDYYLWKNSPLTDRRIFPLLRWLKRRVLLTPIPGLSTHCMSAYMSPCVDWEKYACPPDQK